MKKPNQKYEEAVERNIVEAKRTKNSKCVGMTLSKAKVALGVRSADDKFDAEITAIIAGK